jgi:hypothetical protein
MRCLAGLLLWPCFHATLDGCSFVFLGDEDFKTTTSHLMNPARRVPGNVTHVDTRDVGRRVE